LAAIVYAQTREQQALTTLLRIGSSHDFRHKLRQGAKGAPVLTVSAEVVVLPDTPEENLARNLFGWRRTVSLPILSYIPETHPAVPPEYDFTTIILTNHDKYLGRPAAH
jgi:hypothetical protein